MPNTNTFTMTPMMRGPKTRSILMAGACADMTSRRIAQRRSEPKARARGKVGVNTDQIIEQVISIRKY